MNIYSKVKRWLDKPSFEPIDYGAHTTHDKMENVKILTEVMEISELNRQLQRQLAFGNCIKCPVCGNIHYVSRPIYTRKYVKPKNAMFPPTPTPTPTQIELLDVVCSFCGFPWRRTPEAKWLPNRCYLNRQMQLYEKRHIQNMQITVKIGARDRIL